MRILICTNSIGAKGGIERVTIVKANHYAAMEGVEVAICYTDKGTYPCDTIHPVSPAVKVIDAGVSFWDLYPLSVKNILYTAPRKFVSLRSSLIKIISEYRPDVVVSTGSYEKFALASINLGKVLGKPAVKVREYHFSSNYRDYLKQSSPVISLAGLFEKHILSRGFDKNYLLTREDYETNYNGCDRFDYQHNPFPFDNIETGEKKHVVLAVGRLEYEKNFKALIRIWASIADRVGDWQLWIAGQGPEHDMLENMARDAGVSGSVRILGFRHDMGKLYAMSSISVHTSIHEGFNMSIVEAMAHGVVPVSYRTPYGPADIIEDGVNGILVDYMDEKQFAEKLLQLIGDQDTLCKISSGAAERSRDFSPELICARWIDNYTRLLQNCRWP